MENCGEGFPRSGEKDEISEGPMLMRREDGFARARSASESIADALEEVECDQRLMFKFGLREFSGRLLERLRSARR